MFCISINEIEKILKDYKIESQVDCIEELQRYHYERDNPDSMEVRLIIKVNLENNKPVVIRFKNEEDVTFELIESQCVFADTLRKNGIETPKQYACDLGFAKWYTFGGYDVVVTIEDFVQNEIKEVNASVARQTGELLAKMHQISEDCNLHVDNQVLFDPFEENDLFDFEKFKSIEKDLNDDNKKIFNLIVKKYNEYMNKIDLLKSRNKYAVQGDISNCNLYMTEYDKLGVFDFNRSGDAVLFCDVIMQAVFESRLMDYPENSLDINFEKEILESFLDGYSAIRKFSLEEEKLFPYLYAIITAFWRFDIEFKDDSLINIIKSGNQKVINERLNKILTGLSI